MVFKRDVNYETEILEAMSASAIADLFRHDTQNFDITLFPFEGDQQGQKKASVGKRDATKDNASNANVGVGSATSNSWQSLAANSNISPSVVQPPHQLTGSGQELRQALELVHNLLQIRIAKAQEVDDLGIEMSEEERESKAIFRHRESNEVAGLFASVSAMLDLTAVLPDIEPLPQLPQSPPPSPNSKNSSAMGVSFAEPSAHVRASNDFLARSFDESDTSSSSNRDSNSNNLNTARTSGSVRQSKDESKGGLESEADYRDNQFHKCVLQVRCPLMFDQATFAKAHQLLTEDSIPLLRTYVYCDKIDRKAMENVPLESLVTAYRLAKTLELPYWRKQLFDYLKGRTEFRVAMDNLQLYFDRETEDECLAHALAASSYNEDFKTLLYLFK
jgi:hypothetical protein